MIEFPLPQIGRNMWSQSTIKIDLNNFANLLVTVQNKQFYLSFNKHKKELKKINICMLYSSEREILTQLYQTTFHK